MVQAGVRLSVINTALRVNVRPFDIINEGDDLPFFGRCLTDRERPHEVKEHLPCRRVRCSLVGCLKKSKAHSHRHKPHEPSKQEYAEHGGRTGILDNADFDMMLWSDVIRELFNRRIEQLDGKQNEKHSDQGQIPCGAGCNEESERHCHYQDDHLLAHRSFMRDRVAKPLQRMDRGFNESLHDTAQPRVGCSC